MNSCLLVSTVGLFFFSSSSHIPSLPKFCCNFNGYEGVFFLERKNISFFFVLIFLYFANLTAFKFRAGALGATLI